MSEERLGSIELARQTLGLVQGIASKQTAMETRMDTVAKLVGEDHDTITAMKGTMDDLKASASVTATQSIRIADAAERTEKRETADRKAKAATDLVEARSEADATGRRWKLLEGLAENKWGIALVLLLLAGVNIEPLMKYLGYAPAQVVYVAAAAARAPAPIITEAPVPLPMPAPATVPAPE